MNVFVDHLAYALGEETSTVEEAAARRRLISEPAMLREAGFELHHVAGESTSAYDLAARAVGAVRERLGDVGAIVYATTLPLNGNVGSEARFRETRDVKHLMDFPASHVQADFGLERATVIGLSQQACTGLLGSLRLAAALLKSEPAIGRVLCVTADRFPPGALYEQSYNLISDGAAPTPVEALGEPLDERLLAVDVEAVEVHRLPEAEPPALRLVETVPDRGAEQGDELRAREPLGRVERRRPLRDRLVGVGVVRARGLAQPLDGHGERVGAATRGHWASRITHCQFSP